MLPESQPKENTSYPDFIAFGNVLLDSTVPIDNENLLEKYGLELDNQGEISSEKLKKILEEIMDRSDVKMNPGGSALNTCRIISCLNKIEPLFFGAIGNDLVANITRSKLEENNLITRLQVIESKPSGQCICFVLNEKTALYANIGASSMLSIDFLQQTQKTTPFLLSPVNAQQKQFLYIEGFFIPERYDICKFIISEFVDKDRNLGFNLNSSYILEENLPIVELILKKCSLVFGNKKEYNTLLRLFKVENIYDLSKNLNNNSRKIIFVITNADADVEIYTNVDSDKLERKTYKVFHVPSSNVIDTTGAGDGFVAGFISGFLREETLEECVKQGCNVAANVITQVGCNISNDFIV